MGQRAQTAKINMVTYPGVDLSLNQGHMMFGFTFIISGSNKARAIGLILNY